MARPVRHDRYDYKSGTDIKDWLRNSRDDIAGVSRSASPSHSASPSTSPSSSASPSA